MKYKNVSHWKNLVDQEGLLFFAQIFDEALFDYSLDSYKPQALNIRLLCIETLQTIDNITQGLIKKQNLTAILEELKWSMNMDFALKQIIGEKFDPILENIQQNENNLTRLKTTIHLLYHNLDNKKYLKKLEEILIEKLPQNKEKELIYHLTKAYLTELINYGYNPNYIYYVLNNHFFNRNHPVQEASPEIFFKKFDFIATKFDVVYKVSNVFEEFGSIGKELSFEITKQCTHQTKNSEEIKFIKSVKKDEVFITIKDLERFNEIDARIASETLLLKIANLFSFYHHKDRPYVSEKAIVINQSQKNSWLLEKPLKSIIKKEDIKPKVATQKVKTLISSLNLPKPTINRIGRAIDLHSSALEANQLENKLLNLWTAIETLIPKEIESNQDRINQIIDALIPFQLYGYLENMLKQAATDFINFDRKIARDTINKLTLKQKESLNDSIAAFIVTKENDALLKTVYGSLGTFPLLRWRLFYINKNFSTGKSSLSILELHKRKVEWQIRRIYRVRNLIVHSGKTPTYTNILIENLHNYFDNFVNTIIDMSINEKKIETINEGVLEFNIRVKNHMDYLTDNKEHATTLDNFKKVIGK